MSEIGTSGEEVMGLLFLILIVGSIVVGFGLGIYYVVIGDATIVEKVFFGAVIAGAGFLVLASFFLWLFGGLK